METLHFSLDSYVVVTQRLTVLVREMLHLASSKFNTSIYFFSVPGFILSNRPLGDSAFYQGIET